MRFLLVFVALCSFLPSVAATPAAKVHSGRIASGVFSRNPALPKWAGELERVPETTSDEPVVVRLDETQYWAGPNPAYLVNRAVQVNSTARLSEIGQFAIDFAPAYQKLIIHRIAILRGKQVLDRTQTANVRVLERESEADLGYYLGASTAQVLLEDIAPGDTLWLTYTVEGRNPVLGAAWTGTFPWTSRAPVELRKVVVSYPSKRPLQWRLAGMTRPSLHAPAIEQQGGIIRMTFSERSLAADEMEAALPPNLLPMAVLDFSEFKDWAQVTQWALSLFPDTSAHKEVQALAARFEGKTPEERASKALHWVQDEIRYFSVSIGENSHRPQPPEVVLRRRFGDCKDKSELLVAVYRAMGLQAQPVLVNALGPKFPAQFLPSATSFNHAIVRVVLDGKPYFVDPTRQNERGPVSQLVPAVPGGAALVVDASTTGLVRLPEEVVNMPLVDRTERMKVSGLHGSAQLDVRTEYRGRFAPMMREAYHAMGSFDLKKSVLAELERTYPGIRLDDGPVLADSAGGTGFVVEAKLTIPTALKDEEGRFALPVRSHIIEGTLGIPDKLVRKHPLWLSAGHYRARYNLDVSLPSEARLVQQDGSYAVTTDFLKASSQLTWRGAHLDYYVDYAITNPEVDASSLPKLEEQVHKLDPLFETSLQFDPVSVPPETAAEASLRVLDVMAKLSAYGELQDQAIQTGRIPEIKLDDPAYAKLDFRALCEQLVGLFSVRDWNPLLAAPVGALHKLVNARSDKRSKQLCEARLAFIANDLPAASKELAALVPSDSDPLTLMQAWADFHSGDKTSATANLSRFLKAKSGAGELSARDAAVAFALARRLGMNEPAEVKSVVATLREDAWPMPLFRFLRGEIAADALLKNINELQPAAREYATLEANFFISQVYLASNEPRKADLYLNWLLRYALIGSDYEILARADRFGKDLADTDLKQGTKPETNYSDNTLVRHLKSATQRGNALAEYDLAMRYLGGDSVMQDSPKAVALLESAAAKGLSDAMNELGVIYADGKNVPQDNQRAVAYYRQAAENGNRYAAYNLARAYWFGEHGLPNDPGMAFRFFRDSAEMGDADAQFFLSRMYFDGKGTKKNDGLALFWAVQSHLRHSVDGTAQLGRVLLLASMDKETRMTGLHLLGAAASAQNSFALLELGQILLDGVVVDANPAQAFGFVQTASIFDNDRATALLGRMYVEGLGVSVDRDKGMAMLKRLEKEGNPDAYYQLGLIYQNARLDIVDKAKAADYFRRSAAGGNAGAAEMLAVMLHTGDGIAANLPEAARYYAIAVEAGSARATNNLAALYENGQGVPKDLHHAMELYRRAAQLGNIPAMLNLAELYESDTKQTAPKFLPLAYYMLANRYNAPDANQPLARLKASADAKTISKAEKFAASWKPGKAMPEDL